MPPCTIAGRSIQYAVWFQGRPNWCESTKDETRGTLIGFPYLQLVRIREDHRLEGLPKLGSERVMNPVERGTPLPSIVALYQPIFRSFFDLQDGEKFLENDWVREHTANVGMGYGKLFLQNPNSVQIYPDKECSDWIPSERSKNLEVQHRLPAYVHERIRRDFESSIPLAKSVERCADMQA